MTHARAPADMKDYRVEMLNEARTALAQHVDSKGLAALVKRSTPTRHQATLAGMVQQQFLRLRCCSVLSRSLATTMLLWLFVHTVVRAAFGAASVVECSKETHGSPQL